MTKKRSKRRPSQFEKREADFDALVERAGDKFNSFVIPEPMLLMGGGFCSVDPKFGLLYYGPQATTTSVIRIGIVGTGQGIDSVRNYLERAKTAILPGLNSRKEHYSPLVFRDFPGATRDRGFRTEFITEKSLQREIPFRLIEVALCAGNTNAKLREIVNLWIEKLQTLKESDPEPDVIVMVFPPEVEDVLRTVGREFQQMRLILTPGRKLENRLRKEMHKTGQDYLPLDYEESTVEKTSGYWNLHHAIKAQAMDYGIPTQFAWETMLRGEGLTQDPASTAWNFFTALFYKAGNIPWQPKDVMTGTCFVGVSFYKDSPYANADMRTSLAQVFSGTGEGLVLRGERAVVDKQRDARPHLDMYSSEQLLRQALNLYEQHHQTKPVRVVVHKTSRYWPEELNGFRKALGNVYSYDLLTLEKSDLRFMRLGKEPVLRGTVVELEPRHYLLYTVGYIPQFRMYPGMRIPVPVEVLEHHGDSSSERVCSEILTLTKLNWNSCSFASSDPITILFARSVGKIMTEIPQGKIPQSKYRFYM